MGLADVAQVPNPCAGGQIAATERHRTAGHLRERRRWVRQARRAGPPWPFPQLLSMAAKEFEIYERPGQSYGNSKLSGVCHRSPVIEVARRGK